MPRDAAGIGAAAAKVGETRDSGRKQYGGRRENRNMWPPYMKTTGFWDFFHPSLRKIAYCILGILREFFDIFTYFRTSYMETPIKGDTTGISKPPVDIDEKIAF